MIEAGEASGNLEAVLQRLANELENKKKLQEKIRSAFTYPAVIVVVMIAVIVLLMLVLVPAMKDIYSEFDAELPLVTKILMSASDFFIKFWWLVLMVVAATGVGIKMFLDTSKGKRFFDLIMLKIPIFGKLMIKIQLTQFSRTLSLLLRVVYQLLKH
jgi:type IV pilus assembly protein PilC